MAAQICRIRSSLSRPRRSTSETCDARRTESKLTAETSVTGSSPGSSTTSLGRPRMVVVHGAITASASRPSAASRNSTTTGLRPMSGVSHHQTSPQRGRSVLTVEFRWHRWQQSVVLDEGRPPRTTPSRPTHRAYSGECGRTPRTARRSQRCGVAWREPLGQRPSSPRRCPTLVAREPDQEDRHRP